MALYTDNKKLTVINFFGSPGTGKSTTAAGLFHLMKCQYYNVELVTEYAKDLVWSDRQNMFAEQDYIFAKQNNRLRRLVGKVDYAITDSPLLLGLFYLPWDFPPSFSKFLEDTFNTYDNVNIFLKRTKPYVKLGRNQTEEESDLISENILNRLNQLYYAKYHVFDADESAPSKILELINSNITKGTP